MINHTGFLSDSAGWEEVRSVVHYSYQPCQHKGNYHLPLPWKKKKWKDRTQVGASLFFKSSFFFKQYLLTWNFLAFFEIAPLVQYSSAVLCQEGSFTQKELSSENNRNAPLTSVSDSRTMYIVGFCLFAPHKTFSTFSFEKKLFEMRHRSTYVNLMPDGVNNFGVSFHWQQNLRPEWLKWRIDVSYKEHFTCTSFEPGFTVESEKLSS